MHISLNAEVLVLKYTRETILSISINLVYDNEASLDIDHMVILTQRIADHIVFGSPTSLEYSLES